MVQLSWMDCAEKIDFFINLNVNAFFLGLKHATEYFLTIFFSISRF